MIEQPVITMTASQMIRFARKSRRVTQAEIAAHCGYSERTVQNWEKGKTPPADIFLAILQYLKLTIEQIEEIKAEQDEFDRRKAG